MSQTDCLSFSLPTASQAHWEAVFFSCDWLKMLLQAALAASKAVSGWTVDEAKMWCWRGAVAAAESKKAGSANEAARRIPKPPSLMGRLAWIHWVSDRFEFVITLIPVRWISSNTSNKG